MGEAMLKGWLESGLLKDSDIAVSEKDEAKARLIKERYRVDSDVVITSAASEARTVVVAVKPQDLSLIHISEPTRLGMISYAVFCLKKKKSKRERQQETPLS